MRCVSWLPSHLTMMHWLLSHVYTLNNLEMTNHRWKRFRVWVSNYVHSFWWTYYVLLSYIKRWLSYLMLIKQADGHLLQNFSTMTVMIKLMSQWLSALSLNNIKTQANAIQLTMYPFVHILCLLRFQHFVPWTNFTLAKEIRRAFQEAPVKGLLQRSRLHIVERSLIHDRF